MERDSNVSARPPLRGTDSAESGRDEVIYWFVRAFSYVWYLFCGLFILLGLFFFVTGCLEAAAGDEAPGVALGVIAFSLVFIAIATAFIFVGRYCFRLALLNLNRQPRQSDEQQFESLYSPAAEAVEDQPPLDKSAEIEHLAQKASRLFWVIFCAILVVLLIGFGVAVWATSAIRATAHEFIAALQADEYQRAFELCAPKLQERLGDAQTLGYLVEAAEFYEPFLWSSAGGSGSRAHLGTDGTSVQFIKVDDQWRISGGRWSGSDGRGLRLEPSAIDAVLESQRQEGSFQNWLQKTADMVALVEGLGGTARPGHIWNLRNVEVPLHYALDLSATEVRDADLGRLADIERQVELFIGKRQVRDGDAVGSLVLDDTGITAAGLAHLKDMKHLTELSCRNTQVTDAGLEHLAKLTDLRVLRLDGTQVTDDGVKKLQQALPNCTIHR